MIQTSFAHTDIPSGDVEGTWTTSGSPYLIWGDITIPNGRTLSIEPGVKVEFAGHYMLNVQGQLLAMGEPGDSILFTVQDTTGFSDTGTISGSWNGIRFIDTPAGNDSSKISHCVLQFGKAVAPFWPDNAGGAVCIVHFDKVRISHSTMRFNAAGGTEMPSGGALHLAGANIKLRGNHFFHNVAESGGAVYMYESEPYLSGNYFGQNQAREGGALTVIGSSHPVLQGDSVVNNIALEHGGGVMIWGDCSAILRNAAIALNKAAWGAGLGMVSAGAELQSCSISQNTAADLGGGIAADFSTLTIIGSSIANNAAAMSGGVHCWYTDLQTTATTFDNNTSNYGGAIHADFSDVMLSESAFSNNKAANGGALHIWNSDLVVAQCLFVSNRVTAEGGAIEYNLADTLVFQRPYRLVLMKTDFVENHADARSAGLRITQYNLDMSMVDVMLEGCKFLHNTAERNTALNMTGPIGDFLISNCTFGKNHAAMFGGGSSFADGCSGKVINCLYTQNIADSGNPGTAGISNEAFVHFINCTFTQNSGGNTGALFVHRDGNASVTNCIFWENVPHEIAVRGIRDGALSQLYVNYCDIQYGIDSIQTDDLAVLHWGDGNITDDPSFMDPAGADYRLNEGSSCIDAGAGQVTVGGLTIEAPATDLLGNPRLSANFAPPDIGAYEDQTITSLETIASIFNLSIYPNPFDDQLFIKLNVAKATIPGVRLYNAVGDVVPPFAMQQCEEDCWCGHLNTESLPGGLYFCRVIIGRFSETEKVLLHR